MRSAPGVPVAVPAAPAIATVVLTSALLVLLWSYRIWWWRASEAIPVLSMWGFIAVLLLLVALVVILPTLRPSASQLGLAPTQLVAALGVAAATWSIHHLVQVVDSACFGRAPVGAIDALGDLIGAYEEELIFRVVVLGAIATALRRRMPERRAIAIAIVTSTLLFWLAHLPHDLATGDIADPTPFAVRTGYGLLMAAVYLSSGNVTISAVLHALFNGPMLVIAGAHHVTTTAATNWLCAIALVLWYQRRLARPVRPKHG